VAMGERRSEVAIPAELSLSLDRVRMLRVLTNLLSNVARYTPSSASIRIDAETVEGEGGPWTRITVADDGPGVPPEDLPQLFEPFYRAEQSRSKATGGLGLGLMLVKQIVEAHGGRIAAANRPQGGLRVTIDLPGDQDAAG
jgi:signal transduction histidine kinase